MNFIISYWWLWLMLAVVLSVVAILGGVIQKLNVKKAFGKQDSNCVNSEKPVIRLNAWQKISVTAAAVVCWLLLFFSLGAKISKKR